MKRPRQGLRRAAGAGFALAITVTTLAGPALADLQATPLGPTVKLVAAQNSITTQSVAGAVFLDPGIYVTSLGSALQFDVQRASYTKPVTIREIIYLPGGSTTTRPLPGSVLDGFNGLRDFMRLTVADASGAVVASKSVLFCPNSFDPQRAVPDSALTSPYPQSCALDPFPTSLVMGVARGWGVEPFGGSFRLVPGIYKVTAAITPQYVRLLHINAADATASVKVTVEKGRGYGGAAVHRPDGTPAGVLAALPRVPYLAHPPAAALPDLVPLPSWQIGTSHTSSGHDLLNFAATVWVGGNSPLDVEGFRANGSPIMKAYQYFWRNGHVIGRARVGTMGFAGYNHWHFQQFATYRLLDGGKKLVVRSHKEGFCIAPTDPVALLAPHAVWQPPFTGLRGSCGLPSALWVQEMLPIGWGEHLRPVRPRRVVRHHQRAERNLLRRGDRQPRACPVRIEYP